VCTWVLFGLGDTLLKSPKKISMSSIWLEYYGCYV
jgi:hypothetical protein